MGMSTSELNKRLALDYAYVSSIVAVLSIAGIVGNLSVILINRYKLRRRLGNRRLIPSLAVLDLLTCIFGTSLLILQNARHAIFNETGLCKFLYVTTFSCLCSSSFMIVAITTQRYIQVCRPLERQFTTFWNRYAFVSVVIMGIIVAAPLSVFTGKLQYHQKHYNATGYKCNIIKLTDGRVYFGIFFSILIIIFICITSTLSSLNILIAKTIIRQRKELKLLRRQNTAIRQRKAVCFSSVMMIEYSDLETHSEQIETSPRVHPRHIVKMKASDVLTEDKGLKDVNVQSYNTDTSEKQDVTTSETSIETHKCAHTSLIIGGCKEHVNPKRKTVSFPTSSTGLSVRVNDDRDDCIDDRCEENEVITQENENFLQENEVSEKNDDGESESHILNQQQRISSESQKSLTNGCECLPLLLQRRHKITTKDISRDDTDTESTKFSVMLMVLSVTFVLSWLPLMAVEITEVTHEGLIEKLSPSVSALVRLCECTVIVNNVANPYIYAMFDSEFRERLSHILFCVGLKRFRNLYRAEQQ